MGAHNFLFSIGMVSYCLLGSWSIACKAQPTELTTASPYMMWLGIVVIVFALIMLMVILWNVKGKPAKAEFSKWKTAHFCMKCNQELTTQQVISCHGKCPLCSHQNPHSGTLLDAYIQQYRVKTEGMKQIKEFRPANTAR